MKFIPHSKTQNSNNSLISENELKILPLSQSETIPSAWYTNEEVYKFEKEAIFSKEWQLIGHTCQIQNIGDYIIGDAAGSPVVVIKDNEGKLRAFFNVCRHRGGPLVTENSCTKMFSCKYHGWTYTLEGMLRGVPRFRYVDLFDEKDYGLIPLNVEISEGLIFVNISKSNYSISKALKIISERIKPFDIKSKKFYKRVTYEVNCNWKVYVDNYLEGYHVPFVHPELVKFLDYKDYKTETFDKYSLQYSPVKSESNYLKQGGDAFYYFIYPNIMLNILPGRMQTNIIVPLSHNKTLVVFDYYYDDIESEEAKKIIEDDLDYSDKVQEEDIEICERVQKGLESQGYDKGRFSVECEEGVYHFQCLLKKSFKDFLRKAE